MSCVDGHFFTWENLPASVKEVYPSPPKHQARETEQVKVPTRQHSQTVSGKHKPVHTNP